MFANTIDKVLHLILPEIAGFPVLYNIDLLSQVR